MTKAPDYWTLTVEQKVDGALKAHRISRNIFGPFDKDRMDEAAKLLDAQLLRDHGVVLTDRTWTCDAGWVKA